MFLSHTVLPIVLQLERPVKRELASSASYTTVPSHYISEMGRQMKLSGIMFDTYLRPIRVTGVISDTQHPIIQYPYTTALHSAPPGTTFYMQSSA